MSRESEDHRWSPELISYLANLDGAEAFANRKYEFKVVGPYGGQTIFVTPPQHIIDMIKADALAETRKAAASPDEGTGG